MSNNPEKTNKLVTIEQIENGYIVTLPNQKDETFFDDFAEVGSYLEFYFNVKEEE